MRERDYYNDYYNENNDINILVFHGEKGEKMHMFGSVPIISFAYYKNRCRYSLICTLYLDGYNPLQRIFRRVIYISIVNNWNREKKKRGQRKEA